MSEGNGDDPRPFSFICLSCRIGEHARCDLLRGCECLGPCVERLTEDR